MHLQAKHPPTGPPLISNEFDRIGVLTTSLHRKHQLAEALYPDRTLAACNEHQYYISGGPHARPLAHSPMRAHVCDGVMHGVGSICSHYVFCENMHRLVVLLFAVLLQMAFNSI